MTDDEVRALIRDEVSRAAPSPSPSAFEAALRLLEADPHQWSGRPCATCRQVSALICRPFGCDRRQK